MIIPTIACLASCMPAAPGRVFIVSGFALMQSTGCKEGRRHDDENDGNADQDSDAMSLMIVLRP
jgi:hypothetical protein